jgi:hypothetical protein
MQQSEFIETIRERARTRLERGGRDRHGRDPPRARHPDLGGAARKRRGAATGRARRRARDRDRAVTDLGTEGFLDRVENENREAGVEGDTETHVGAALSTFERTVDESGRQGVRSRLPEDDRLF